LYSEEDHTFLSSLNIIRVSISRRMELIELRARMGYMRNAYKRLVGKTKGKNPLGRARRKWQDNMDMHIKGICCEGADGLKWLRVRTIDGFL
jgi:hypothetical protein